MRLDELYYLDCRLQWCYVHLRKEMWVPLLLISCPLMSYFICFYTAEKLQHSYSSAFLLGFLYVPELFTLA